jgi:signal transduction histidine kinase
LMGMEERVRLHGGRLEIRSVPGEGTCVCAIVPLIPQREGDDSES